MTKSNYKLEILKKQIKLESAEKSLKQDFFGIDREIEEIIKSVSSWYMLPNLQKQPLVVNLWGLTGTGKTALIEKLAKLLNMEKTFFKFDLGENSGNNWTIKDTLKEINQYYDTPIIICFDEFQHAKSRNSCFIWVVFSVPEF